MVRAARFALALYVLAAAAITLGPRPDRLFNGGLRAVTELTDGAASSSLVEAGANVLLFVPLAFLLCRSFPAVRPWLAWVLCTGASLTVELWQWAAPGRDATLRDVVTNALGAAIGVALSWVLDSVIDRSGAQSGRATPRG
ncbi:VanZ family protein [Blastococcus sp. URHD0036]|uniref:VanZ family protein n=1 Tax=Blastococcus sp. URHD0036 TaxID=1380356 RepID=UPI0006921B82|nr:VanZ family protein [Blastococcus sp. URHD0036]